MWGQAEEYRLFNNLVLEEKGASSSKVSRALSGSGKGLKGAWVFWSKAEGLELGKDYRDIWQVACFLVNLGRAPRLKDLFFHYSSFLSK